jgi:hypothetical protein
MTGSSAASPKDIHLRLQQPLFEEIEKFRRGEADIPSRPTAVRRLLQQAVNALHEVGDERAAAA